MYHDYDTHQLPYANPVYDNPIGLWYINSTKIPSHQFH